MNFASQFARRILSMPSYGRRHFEVQETDDGCLIVEHNGGLGCGLQFIGEPFRLVLSHRVLCKGKALGHIEDDLRRVANQIHEWADRRPRHVREFMALPWQLFSDYA